MQIKTTGIENYLPGGQSNMKMLIVGGPGAGKTRWSSFWPKPFFLNVENGLASVADRKVAYADISTSADMLKALKFLAHHPDAKQYGTVVLDSLDGYQRRVKDEWLQDNPGVDKFSGYDAWGYLDARMQILLTRLLNLRCNVIVIVHEKDKTITERVGKDTVERHEVSLQLQGDTKESTFNEFDLVGHMQAKLVTDTSTGEKVMRRTLSFTPTLMRPFLKDRFHIVDGEELEVTFTEDDYNGLMERFMSRVDGMPDSTDVGEVPDVDEQAILQAGEPVNVPSPQQLEDSSGALDEQPAVPPPGKLESKKKAELLNIADAMGVEVDPKDTKAQIVEKLHADKPAEQPAAQPAETVDLLAEATDVEPSPYACQGEPGCGADAEGDVADLAQVKFGKRLCLDCYEKAKKKAKAA